MSPHKAAFGPVVVGHIGPLRVRVLPSPTPAYPPRCSQRLGVGAGVGGPVGLRAYRPQHQGQKYPMGAHFLHFYPQHSVQSPLSHERFGGYPGVLSLGDHRCECHDM